MTPGQKRAHAQHLRHEAADLRRMAAGATIHHWRDKWTKDADRFEDDADWFDESADRFDYLAEINSCREAAE